MSTPTYPMPTTTLRLIREHGPCAGGWKKLCKSLGGQSKYGLDTPITLLQILDSNGLDDALWCLRACPDSEAFSRAVARWCALQVAHLWDTPEIARRYLETGDESLRAASWAAAQAAQAAAGAASWAAAQAAGAASWAAAQAAQAARDAARDAQAQHLREMLAPV